ncbi:MAG: hypothetical protein Q9195_001707 [Heterodermia aff. obscurata]
MQAVAKDVPNFLNLPFLPQDQKGLDSFVAHLSSAPSIFNALDDESSVKWEHSRPFSAAIEVTYCRLNAFRFKQSYTTKFTIQPIAISVFPPSVVVRNRRRTKETVDGPNLLSSHMSFTVKYQLEAVHEGMRNAITQGKYDALVTFFWLAIRLGEFKVVGRRWNNDRPFEPPQEPFRLVARQGLEKTADKSHGSIGLFKLLLCAHAESMPSHDRDIKAWAESIASINGGNDNGRAFASWIVDCGCQERCNEVVRRWGFRVGAERRPEEEEEVRRPLLRAGNILGDMVRQKMVRRFVDF